MGARDNADFLDANGPSTQTKYRKSMKARLESMSHRHRITEVFSDVMAMIAIALSNRCDLNQYEKRENEYLEIARKYSKEELMEVAKIYAELCLAMETAPRDVLGELYMELEVSNSKMGQFFTPSEVCSLMAKLLLDREKAKSIVKTEGFITLQDPACGGGAMIIAFADALRENNINYQQQLHVTAIDLDITAVHMTYIQLSILFIPAIITCGNSLTLKEYSRWYTNAHILNGWNFKLRRRMNKNKTDGEGFSDLAPNTGCGVVANTEYPTSGNVETRKE